MAMNRADFQNAFREVVSAEFSDVPTEQEIDFIFSKRMNRRMQRLIKSQRKSYYYLTNTLGKRIAVAVIFILLTLTTSMSVKAIREPILEFIRHVYATFTEYSYHGDTTDVITTEYSIRVPDAFTLKNEIRNDAMIYQEYVNASGDIIEFNQMTTGYSTGYFLDNSRDDIVRMRVGEYDVDYKRFDTTQSAVWLHDGYLFIIDCYGNVDLACIRQIIETLEKSL